MEFRALRYHILLRQDAPLLTIGKIFTQSHYNDIFMPYISKGYSLPHRIIKPVSYLEIRNKPLTKCFWFDQSADSARVGFREFTHALEHWGQGRTGGGPGPTRTPVQDCCPGPPPGPHTATLRMRKGSCTAHKELSACAAF